MVVRDRSERSQETTHSTVRPSAFPGQEVQVKGQSFHSVLGALEQMRGDGFREDVLAVLAGECGEALRGGFLLSSNFYPVSWYRDLFAAASELAPGALHFAREIGRVSGERDLRGIYRVLVRALSTERLVRQSPRLFRVVYQGGGVEVLETGKGAARVRYFDCFGFDRNVWQDAIGGASAVFRATGAESLAMRVESGGGDGDSEMTVCVTWK